MNTSKEELISLASVLAKLENFVKYILKATPTAQQLSIIRAVDKGHLRIAIKSGHGTGKSTLLSWIALWWLLTKFDAKIPTTAPAAPQLLATLMPEIKKWWRVLPQFLKDEFVLTSDYVRCANGNFLVMRTAKKEAPEALQGFHASNLIYLVDEASGVDNALFEVIEGALTGEKNALFLVGNPTRTSGYFYDAFHKSSELFECFTLNAELSENVSKEKIKIAKKAYGENSNAYRIRILGEFPLGSSDALFKIYEIEEAFKRGKEQKINSGNEIWGLDVAEFGDDKSVLARRMGYEFKELITFDGLDAQSLADEICEIYKRAKQKPKAIYIDVIGIGAGVWSILSHRNLPAYRADCRGKGEEKEHFNKRSTMYLRLKEYIGLISFAKDDDELFGELGAITYKFSPNGATQISPKSEIKKALGRSPDKADALALSFFEEFFEDEKTDDEASYNAVYYGSAGAW